jgi:hypothetical protein
MSHKPDCCEELTRLVSALLDGRITPDEMARLESLLKQDDAARKLYMQLVDQEIEFSCVVSAEGRDAASKILPSPFTRQPERKSPSRYSLLAMAAALVLLAIVTFALFAPPEWRGSKEAKSGNPPARIEPKTATTPSRIAEHWSEDFEGGAAKGWTGTMISNALPDGSRFGIAAVPMEYPGGVAYGIRLPEDWNEGLFVVTQRSTLHATYQLRSSSGVNVFMHTISAEPGGNRYEMYQLMRPRAFRWVGQRWQTVSVPFSHFVRKVRVEPGGNLEFRGGPPQSGELATTLIFSSPTPLDLVIDRVWITPDGPNEEEVIPLTPQRRQ